MLSYAGDSDGLSDPETMTAFIKVMSPDFTVPAGGTFKENTSSYKNCRKNCGTYLPFVIDSAEVRAFDECVCGNYGAALSNMASFTNSFLEVETSAKKDEYLVKALAEIIKDDEGIPSNAVFYINADGSSSTKVQLLAATEICLQAFLIGVWHYVLLNRTDNTQGRSTIVNWKPTYSDTPIRRVYSAVISNVADESFDRSEPTVEAEILDDDTKIPSGGQASPKEDKKTAELHQTIMNNYGKGVQIEKVEGTLTININ